MAVLGLIVQAAGYQRQGLTECTLHLGPEHYGSARSDAVAAVVTRELQTNGFPVIGSTAGDWSGNVGITVRLSSVSEAQWKRVAAAEATVRQYEADQSRSRTRGAAILAVVLVTILVACWIYGATRG